MKTFEFYYNNILQKFNHKLTEDEFNTIIDFYETSDNENFDDYLNAACVSCKNCYCCFNCKCCNFCSICNDCSNCKYCKFCSNCENCNNCNIIFENNYEELYSYNLINCSNCVNCSYCSNCENCINTSGATDLINIVT